MKKEKTEYPIENNIDIPDGPLFTMKRIKKKKSEASVLNPRYVYQRAKYGFCEYDAIFISRWFCRVVPDMLEYMADNLWSHPSRLEYEYWEKHKDELGIPSFIDIMANRIDDSLYEKISDEVTRDWQEILRRMAHLFRESIPGESPDEGMDDDEYQEKCMKEALELFSKWFGDLWSW